MNAVNFLNVEYVFLRIADFFNNFDLISFLNGIIHFLEFIDPLFAILALFFIVVFIYAHFGIHKVEHQMGKIFEPLPSKAEAEAVPANDADLHKKWTKIQDHIASANQAEWRLAILEADIMLDDILDKHGYQGDSIGDKLKTVDKSDFLTLAQAKEAHYIRNQIAHQGSDYDLNERDAKRTIDLYKQVFEEFYHI